MLLLHNAEAIVKRVVTLIRVYHFYGNHMDTKEIAFFSPFKTIFSRQVRFYEVVLERVQIR